MTSPGVWDLAITAAVNGLRAWANSPHHTDLKLLREQVAELVDQVPLDMDSDIPWRSRCTQALDELYDSWRRREQMIEDGLGPEEGADKELALLAERSLSSALGIISQLETFRSRLSPAKSSTTLTLREEEILIAMLNIRAVSKQSRRSGEDIATEAWGENDKLGRAKTELAKLKSKNLVESYKGQQGGSWLTENGAERASTLRNQSKT